MAENVSLNSSPHAENKYKGMYLFDCEMHVKYISNVFLFTNCISNNCNLFSCIFLKCMYKYILHTLMVKSFKHP